MANGNGETVGVKIPEWMTGAAKQYGLVGLIVLVLLGAFLGIFDNPLTRIATSLEAHIKDTDKSNRIQVQTAWYNQRVLEQICIRLSTTPRERSDCLPMPTISQAPNENDTRSHR